MDIRLLLRLTRLTAHVSGMRLCTEICPDKDHESLRHRACVSSGRAGILAASSYLLVSSDGTKLFGTQHLKNDIRKCCYWQAHEARHHERKPSSANVSKGERFRHPNVPFPASSPAHLDCFFPEIGQKGFKIGNWKQESLCSCAILPTAKAWPRQDLQRSQPVATLDLW
jgi:hypothetical protein